MKEEVREIVTISKLIRETMVKYGNPIGISSKDLVKWSQGLDLPSSGETIFYTGMYPYMGYAETALILEYIVEKEGLSLLDLLKWLDIASKFGFKKNIFSIIRFLRSRFYRMVVNRLLPANIEKILVEEALKVDERNKYYMERLRKGVSLLKRKDVNIAYLGEKEPDTGISLHTFGFRREFHEIANRNYNIFKSIGVKRIITMDPISAAALKIFYPKEVKEFDIEILHISEALPKLHNGNPKIKKVVYHDPCYLVRYLALVEEPRSLIENMGVSVIDPPNSRRLTRCDGGGIEYQEPLIAVEQAKIRLQELLSTNTDNIVTSCPVCLMLLRIASYLSPLKANIYDLVDILED